MPCPLSSLNCVVLLVILYLIAQCTWHLPEISGQAEIKCKFHWLFLDNYYFTKCQWNMRRAEVKGWQCQNPASQFSSKNCVRTHFLWYGNVQQARSFHKASETTIWSSMNISCLFGDQIELTKVMGKKSLPGNSQQRASLLPHIFYTVPSSQS